MAIINPKLKTLLEQVKEGNVFFDKTDLGAGLPHVRILANTTACAVLKRDGLRTAPSLTRDTRFLLRGETLAKKIERSGVELLLEALHNAASQKHPLQL
jgi:hypothetical protein